MRSAAAIGVVALSLAGCGGVTPEDEVAAERTLLAYGRAYAAYDGDAACRLLTDKMRGRYERDGASCTEAFARMTSSDGRRLRLERAEVTGAEGEGLRGVVEFSESGGPGTGGEVRLVRSGDRWLVAVDLSCITPGCEP